MCLEFIGIKIMMSEYVGLLCKLLYIYKIIVLYNYIKIIF